MKPAEFVTVATFDTSALAHIAKGKLEAEGIKCFLDGEHHVSTDWLISNAVGGIKLVVNSEDFQVASGILNNEESVEVDPEFDMDQFDSDEGVECPSCQSKNINDAGYHHKSIFLSILFLGFPLPFGSKTAECEDCGLKWIPE